MTYFDWVSLALVACMLVTYGLSWTDWQARRRLMAVESPGLRALPESTTRVLANRLVRRSRAGIVVGLVAFLVSYGWIRATSHPVTDGDVWVTVLLFGLGSIAGMVVVATRQQLAASDSPLRVARTRAIRIGDYVPTSLRVAGWISVGCVVAAVSIQDTLQLSTGPLTSRQEHTLVSNTLIATFALIGMIAFEVAGRAIIARPQPAGSTDELMWDDAIRAATLRDLVRLPVIFGSYGFVFAIVRGLNWSYGVASIIVFGLFTICLAFLLVSVLIIQTSKEHYLDRLWSNRPRSDFDDEDAIAGADASEAGSPFTTDSAASSIGGAR